MALVLISVGCRKHGAGGIVARPKTSEPKINLKLRKKFHIIIGQFNDIEEEVILEGRA
jgi:hypothetical protein